MAQSTSFFSIKEVENLTTGDNIITVTMDRPYYAIEFDTDSISVEARPRSCNIGQLVRIEGILVSPGAQVIFVVIAKVEKIDQYFDGTLSVFLRFLQYNKDAWHDYLHEMQKLQDQVDDLFLLMKDEV